LAADSADAWVIDLSAPGATILPVNPDPHPLAVDELTIVFNEPITGLDLGDLSLALDGGANLLTGAQTLTTSDNTTWKLEGLAGLTNAVGQYTLTLASPAGISDLAGIPLAAPVSESWTRAPWLPGDANLDGTVDLTDFGILKANFGAGDEWLEGDFNVDGQVDLGDFGILKANFGLSGSVAAAPPPAAAFAQVKAAPADAAAVAAAWAAWDGEESEDGDELLLGSRKR
jgi:hypothetical protein